MDLNMSCARGWLLSFPLFPNSLIPSSLRRIQFLRPMTTYSQTMSTKDADNVAVSAGWYLTAPQMQFLRTVPYHYNAWSRSILERIFFQP
jgi:hypothetical protein